MKFLSLFPRSCDPFTRRSSFYLLYQAWDIGHGIKFLKDVPLRIYFHESLLLIPTVGSYILITADPLNKRRWWRDSWNK